MNPSIKCFLLLICAIAIVGPGEAQTIDPTNEESFDTISVEARLHQLWTRYKEAKLTGSSSDQSRAYAQFTDWRSRSGSDIFETGAYLFLEEGLEDLEKGNLDAARDEFHHAIDLNPHLWPAYSGLAHINLEEGNYLQYFRLGFRGMSEAISLQNPYFFSSMVLWLLRVLLWVLILVFTAFSVLMIVKYVRPAYATTHGQMSSRFPEFYAKVIAAALIVWPLLLGLNFYLTAALFLFIFFPFLVGKERLIAILLFLVLLLLPLTNLAIAHVNTVRTDPLLRAHLTRFQDMSDNVRLEQLQKNPGTGELAHHSYLIMGQIWASRGDNIQAMDLLDRIPKSSSMWPLAEVNRGNIHLISRDYRQAQLTYESALDARSNLSEALYNLSLLFDELGDLEKAEQFRTRAVSIDPSLRTMVRVSRVSENSEPLTALPPARGRVITSLLQFDSALTAKLETAGFWIPAIVFLVLLIASFIHSGLRDYSLLARICQKCGRIYYQSDSTSNRCSQCVSLYTTKADLPSEAKNKKYEEVKAYGKRRRILYTIVQLFLPGSKKILRGQTVAGFFIVLVWIFILVPSLAPPTALLHHYILYLPLMTLPYGLWLSITVVFWIIFGLRPIWKED